MIKFAAKIAYYGEYFAGSQKQPGKRTVQGELEKVLGPVKLASRTDAGVSSLGAVCTFMAEKMPNIHHLNFKLPDDLKIVDIKEVNEDFKPRHASMKIYKYFLPDTGSDLAVIRKNIAKVGKLPRTDVKEINVEKQKNFIVLTFHGSHFGYHSVRKIVGAITGTGKSAPPGGLVLVETGYPGLKFANNLKPAFLEKLWEIYLQKLQEKGVLGLIFESLKL